MHAIIFDIDGTLIQSVAIDETLYADAIRFVLGSVKFRPSWADYDRVTDRGILSQVFTDNSIAEQPVAVCEIERVFVENLNAHFASRGPLLEVPGAKAYVQSLCESPDHSVAIATGAWRSSAIAKLESAGFDVGLAPLATCNDSDIRTEIMNAALARIGSRFDSITYYGDGSWDEDACSELGWNFVAVGPVLDGIKSYFGETAA